MPRADQAYRDLLLTSAVVALVLVLPLAITLFPGALQRALHGTGELVLTCAATVYQLGARLPPLGLGVLAFAGAAFALAASRSWGMLRRTRRVLARRRHVRAPGRLRRAASLVRIADRVRCFADPRPGAYCAGLLRPTVWVSTGIVRRLRREELEAVLWHEARHLGRRDPLRLFVARVLASLLFAVPLIRELVERFELAAELDADRAAIAAQGSVSGLAGALYKLGDGAGASALARSPPGPSPTRASSSCAARRRLGSCCARLAPRGSSAPPASRPRCSSVRARVRERTCSQRGSSRRSRRWPSRPRSTPARCRLTASSCELPMPRRVAFDAV